jgi:hypothetical protein
MDAREEREDRPRRDEVVEVSHHVVGVVGDIAIMLLDIATATFTEIDPQPGTLHSSSAIGADTVVSGARSRTASLRASDVNDRVVM